MLVMITTASNAGVRGRCRIFLDTASGITSGISLKKQKQHVKLRYGYDDGMKKWIHVFRYVLEEKVNPFSRSLHHIYKSFIYIKGVSYETKYGFY